MTMPEWNYKKPFVCPLCFKQFTMKQTRRVKVKPKDAEAYFVRTCKGCAKS